MSTNHWSSASRRSVLAAGLAATFAAGAASVATPARAAGQKGGSMRAKWHHLLRSTPDKLHWGGFPIGWTPGLTRATRAWTSPRRFRPASRPASGPTSKSVFKGRR